MPLNLGEATAVNVLADYLLEGGDIDPAKAREALALLAAGADKRLHTGITDAQVRDLWDCSHAPVVVNHAHAGQRRGRATAERAAKCTD
jgi:hypothetical protein